MKKTFNLLLVAFSFLTKSAFSQTTCSQASDCLENEICATGGLCTPYDCEGLYSIIKDQIEGIQEIQCSDYSGKGEGLIYACSVTAGATSTGSAALAIDPSPADDSGVIVKDFSRECTAEIPATEEQVASRYSCLDTKTVDVASYEAAVAASALDCGDAEPVHATTRFDLMTGFNPQVVIRSEFSSTIARSGFYATIFAVEDGDGSSNQGSGAASSCLGYRAFINASMVLITGALTLG